MMRENDGTNWDTNCDGKPLNYSDWHFNATFPFGAGKGGDCMVTLYFELPQWSLSDWNTFIVLSSSFGLSDKIRLLLMISAQLLHPMIRDLEYLNRSISEYSDEIKYWCISNIYYISPHNWIGKWIMCCPLIGGLVRGCKFESMRSTMRWYEVQVWEHESTYRVV